MSKTYRQPFDEARLHDARKQLNEAKAEINQIDEAIERTPYIVLHGDI